MARDLLGDFLADRLAGAGPVLGQQLFDRWWPCSARSLRDLRRAKLRKFSLRPTKSVSQFTSTSTPVLLADVRGDGALGGDASGLLAGGGQTLLAKDHRGLLHVAIRLGERGS